MKKCFWCGAANEQEERVCAQCGRDLQWSSFLTAMVKPSLGNLLGKEQPVQAREIVGSQPLARI